MFLTNTQYTVYYNIQLGHFLKNVFLKIGPAGVKIGQVLCHRKDVFAKETCQILKDLTNNVPGLTHDEEVHMLQYAKKITHYTKTPKKIGAGCIAVTYLTRVEDTDVVLKIKRPHIQNALETSFENIYTLLRIFGRNSINDKVYHIKDSLLKQTDFIYELSEVEYFYEKYQKSNTFKNIIIPQPYRHVSNNNIITLEYLKGDTPLSENENITKIETCG